MSLTLSDPSTNWAFTCLTHSDGTHPPEGGLVLQDVRHSLHNFARDMRLVGLRLSIQEVEPPDRVVSTTSYYLPLSDPPFSVGEIRILTPSISSHPSTPGGGLRYLREVDEALYFRNYFIDDRTRNYLAYGVRADYTLPASYFATHWPNCEVSSLTISQRFLFSHEGHSPRHEPSGGLDAARCHPLVRYEFTLNQAVDRRQRFTRVESIRFDYRLHLFIDRHYDVAENATLSNLGNQAGLFRDNETASVLGGAVGFFTLSRGTSFTGAAFAAVEKPLVYEVTAPALAKGFSIYNDGQQTRICWDNVHWWGARGGDRYISAPGAFHAAHIHWRWGAAGTSSRIVTGSFPEIDTSGVPADVQQRREAGGLRGALVDPNCWIQTIRVAVIKNEPSLDPNQRGVRLEDLCREDWKTLFTGLRGTPLGIFTGEDLVFWYSAEVYRTITLQGYTESTPPNYTVTPTQTYYARPSGTVFLHGIFFAHSAEVTGLQVGSTRAEHWPKDFATLRRNPQWFRSAE